jgi:hypothetical protein
VLERDAIDALLARVGPATFESPPEELDLGWWQAMDEAEIVGPPRDGYTADCPTDAAVRFHEELLARRPDPDALDVCIAAIGEASAVDDANNFVVAVRKGDPVATLLYGLGFAAAARLPGRAGCFLLPAAADAELAAFADLFDLAADERARFAERVSRWLEVMSDQTDLDPFKLLDGPLSLARRARETSSGLLAVMQWF